MDLSSVYLGFALPHPLIAGASPLADDIDRVRRLEDAGAAAIVMRSLFQEQIEADALGYRDVLEVHQDFYAEAQSFVPQPDWFRLGPEEYLEQLARIKAAVDLPVLGSLNGTTLGGWIGYAGLMAEAGADAIELNVYELETDPTEDAQAVEARTLELVAAVKHALDIPIAIKLSPYYSALAHFAVRLEGAGADGMVLFNRLYQPDIDIEALEVERSLTLSTSDELVLRLQWLATLSPVVTCSLAASGGVHSARDALKAVMAGADAVQMVSALLQRGPEYLTEVRLELAQWLEAHEYESLDQARASMNLETCPDPRAYGRINYIHLLQTDTARFGALSRPEEK